MLLSGIGLGLFLESRSGPLPACHPPAGQAERDERDEESHSEPSQVQPHRSLCPICNGTL
jgi:hypothetical protein